MEKMPKFNKKDKIYQESGNAEIVNIDNVLNELQSQAEKILDKIAEKIRNQNYGMVLGVDAGGRLPSLLIGKAINKVYGSNRQEKIDINFIAGHKNENFVGDLNSYFSGPMFQSIKQNKKEVLLVDDVVESGNSIKPVIEALNNQGIPFEFVTLSVSDNVYHSPSYDKKLTMGSIQEYLDTDVIYGDFGVISSVYGKPQMVGVKKNRNSLHSISINTDTTKNDPLNIPRFGEGQRVVQNPEILKYTRREIDRMSTELSDKIVKGGVSYES